jgi:hypothetical protein
VFLQEAGVEGIRIVYKVLEVLKSELGSKRGATERLEKLVKGIGPEADNDVVLCGNVAERCGDGRGEGDFE